MNNTLVSIANKIGRMIQTDLADQTFWEEIRVDAEQVVEAVKEHGVRVEMRLLFFKGARGSQEPLLDGLKSMQAEFCVEPEFASQVKE